MDTMQDPIAAIRDKMLAPVRADAQRGESFGIAEILRRIDAALGQQGETQLRLI
jgi:hypothetical protein